MFSLKKAHDIEDMVRIIKEDQKLKNALLTKIAEENKDLKILYKQFPMDNYYQIVPLLQEIAKEDLEKSEIEQKNNHRRQSFYFWEETRVRDKESRYEKREIKDLLEDFRNIVPKSKTAIPRFLVIGPPGSGKSTLMQYMARRIARGEIKMGNSKVLPIHISLAKWQRWADGKNYGLAQYLTTLFSSLSIRPDEIQWQKWLEKGEVLLLLDGLDELSDNVPDFFENAVRKNFQDFPQCPAILTCRTVVYEQYQTLDIPAFVLAGFDEEQQKKYIENFPAEKDSQYNPSLLWEQIQDSQMQPLASNPFLLSMICYVVDDPKEKIALPSTRSLFYQKAMDKLLQRTRIAVDCPKLLVKQDVLAKIALDLFLQDQRESFSQAELFCTFRKAIEKSGYSLDKGEALLDDFIKNSGIIQKEPNRDSYFFLHLTFQEFLAANALANIVNDNNGKKWESKIKVGNKAYTIRMVADKKAWDPAWQEVMLLFAGQLEDPMPFLEMLSNPEPTHSNPSGDDIFRHRLLLATLCLPQISSEKQEGQDLVRDIIIEAFYFFWKNQERGPLWQAIDDNFFVDEEQGLQSLNSKAGIQHIHCLKDISDEERMLQSLNNKVWRENILFDIERKEIYFLELLSKTIKKYLEDKTISEHQILLFLISTLEEPKVTKAASYYAPQKKEKSNELLRFILYIISAKHITLDSTPLFYNNNKNKNINKITNKILHYEIISNEVNRLREIASIKSILNDLFCGLNDKSPYVRKLVVKALEKIGERQPLDPILHALFYCLCDEDSCVRNQALNGLVNIMKKANIRFFKKNFIEFHKLENLSQVR